jgi:hypothetical protein
MFIDFWGLEKKFHRKVLPLLLACEFTGQPGMLSLEADTVCQAPFGTL